MVNLIFDDQLITRLKRKQRVFFKEPKKRQPDGFELHMLLRSCVLYFTSMTIPCNKPKSFLRSDRLFSYTLFGNAAISVGFPLICRNLTNLISYRNLRRVRESRMQTCYNNKCQKVMILHLFNS